MRNFFTFKNREATFTEPYPKAAPGKNLNQRTFYNSHAKTNAAFVDRTLESFPPPTCFSHNALQYGTGGRGL